MKFGDELRSIVKEKKETREISELKKVLLKAANQGKDIINLSSMEEKYPCIIDSGYIWGWLRDNNISCSGERNSQGHVNYTIYWQKSNEIATANDK